MVRIIRCQKLVNREKHHCAILVEWFRDNFLRLNADNYNLIVSGYKWKAMYASVGDALLSELNSVKLLGFFIDSTLNFDKQLQTI